MARLTLQQALERAMKHHQAGELSQAEGLYRQILSQQPNHPVALHFLGLLAHQVGRNDAAVELIKQAVVVRPDYADAFSNLGIVFKELDRFEEAIVSFRRAIELRSDLAAAHWNLSLLLLATGDFASGWEEFEWRLKLPGNQLHRGFSQPQWDGSNAAGKTILLHAEGGFGDAIQFIRFVPMLRDRGARFILECQPALVSLLAQVAGIDLIVARGEALPASDEHIPLQGLPRVVGITMGTIPAEVPYLNAPAERLSQWANRVPKDGLLNVGLVWAGSEKDQVHRSRSLLDFSPLAGMEGVRFFSLQIGPESTEQRPAGLYLIDLTSNIRDFADTAALIHHLDLVITVDTSVAHLAGAMNRPVWVLIPKRSDFRWLLNRDDSPWYPSMRLFRQTQNGEWQGVASQLRDQLSRWVADRRLVFAPDDKQAVRGSSEYG